jgi:hypothetical protein
MENITQTQAEKEIKILKKYFKNYTRMTKLGYEKRELGCEKSIYTQSIYTHSGSISIIEPARVYRDRHPEKMLAIGLYKYSRNGHPVYFAYVKRIIN